MDKQKIEKSLKTFKCLILDGDGVLFSGDEYRGVLSDGRVVVMKSRHFHDGQGITFLRAIGIKILFATAEGEPMESVIYKLNNLPGVLNGTFEKVEVLTNLQIKNSKMESIEMQLQKDGFGWGDCVYIGDDRTDLESMKKVGLVVTPINGQRLIKKFADIILSKEGGKGAIREFSEMVLDIRDIDESTLPSA